MMLTAEGCQQRRQRLWDRLTDAPDWILIANPRHLMYLANFAVSGFVFRSNDAAAVLILGKDGSSTLVTDSMVRSYAENAFVDQIVAPTWYDGNHSAPLRRNLLVQSTLEVLSQCPGKLFGLEPSYVPAGIVTALEEKRGKLELTNVEPLLHLLKRKKDADELELIRKSVAAIDAGQIAALESVKPGMTEFEVFLLIQQTCCEVLGEQVPVYGDFVSGPNCERGGGPPSHRKIGAGDLVLLDFSAVVNLYRGDTANTFICAGSPNDQQQQFYEALLESIQAGEALLKPGTACSQIDAAIKQNLDKYDLSHNFPSHSGHGLGLGHPDPPYIVANSSDSLEVGDVVTLEPSQIVAGVAGMRYEHNYLITETGFEQLSQHPLQLVQ